MRFRYHEVVPAAKTSAPRAFVAVPPPYMGRDLHGVLETGLVEARSPAFFSTELHGPTQESGGMVRVNKMEPRVFKALLSFMYTDSLSLPETTTKQEEASFSQHLLVAAHRYGMERLKLLCKESMCRRIEVGTAANLLALAEQLGCRGLMDGSGVWFTEAVASCFLEDVEYLEHAMVIAKDELLPPTPAQEETSCSHYLLVQVTTFACGGFVVGVCFSHAVSASAAASDAGQPARLPGAWTAQRPARCDRVLYVPAAAAPEDPVPSRSLNSNNSSPFMTSSNQTATIHSTLLFLAGIIADVSPWPTQSVVIFYADIRFFF